VNNRPIGVFDSGVGGLSVLRELVQLLPQENFVYLADQANVPYGGKSAETIQQLSHQITHYLLTQHHCKLIVVACNTATAAALTYLRQTYVGIPFVGMEPAIKPAAQASRSGKVGVLATNGTFSSQRYADLMARYANGIELFEDSCAGLVELVEDGKLNTPQTAALLRLVLTPMIDVGVDTLVLGCTHYPFVAPLIQRIAGDNVTLIDPAPAVARQVAHRLAEMTGQFGIVAGRPSGKVKMITTGNPERFNAQVDLLLPPNHVA
jgi:glutamate racemase